MGWAPEAWTDVDLVQHALAEALELAPRGSDWNTHKALYWTANPIGDGLLAMLRDLVAMGVLEERDEPDLQFRANPAFQLDY